MGFFNSASWKTTEVKNPAVSMLPKCGTCGLYKSCRSPKLAPAGNGARRILFVGGAPDGDEDKSGRVFGGAPADRLRGMLDAVGVDMDACRMTYAAICHPPRNNIEETHVTSCRPNLLRVIKDERPNVIIPLGADAVRALLVPEWGTDIGAIRRWAGWAIPSPYHGAWVCPTYHPGDIKSDDVVLERIVRGHLDRAVGVENSKIAPFDARRAGDEIDIITRPDAFSRRLERLAGQSGVLAWDYETTGLKPERPEQQIFCAAFCLDGRDTFAGLVTPAVYPALSAVLKNANLRKVGSNIKFEERWSRAKLGHGVAGWHWDVMLAAHVADNRPDITSVKFQAYVRLGVGPYHWNSSVESYLSSVDGTANGLNRIREANPEDVLRYCGLDAVIEYHVMGDQQKEMRWQSCDRA